MSRDQIFFLCSSRRELVEEFVPAEIRMDALIIRLFAATDDLQRINQIEARSYDCTE